MPDLVVRDMTQKEAEAAVSRFAGHWAQARAELLEMKERNAHKALGYPTFADFAKTRLGIKVSDRTIENHIAAARVDRNLSAVRSTSGASIAPEVPKLPLLAALELNKLPDHEQPDAYAELKALEKSGTHLPKQVERALTDIVKRRLNLTVRQKSSEIDHGTREDLEEEETPAPASPYVPDLRPATAPVVVKPTPTAPIAPTRPKANFTPIVPPTYDRGPEFDDEPIIEPLKPAIVEAPASAAVEPIGDCVRDLAVGFVVRFDKIMRGGGSLEDLHMDVIAFRKQYSV